MASILERGVALKGPHSLHSDQLQMSALMEGFVAQASDVKNWASMMAGAFAYRLGNIGFLKLGACCNMPLRLGIAPLFGLASEVSAFRSVNYLLNTPLTPTLSPGERVSARTGEGGEIFGKEWLGTFTDFALLKGAGSFTQGQNIFLSHFTQDLAMVGGHELSANLGFTEHAQGGFVEKMIHAQTTNMAMSAGMAFAHLATGGKLLAAERSLDLEVKSLEARPLRFIFPEASLAIATQGRIEANQAPSNLRSAREFLILAGKDEGRGQDKRSVMDRVFDKKDAESDPSRPLVKEAPILPLVEPQMPGEVAEASAGASVYVAMGKKRVPLIIGVHEVASAPVVEEASPEAPKGPLHPSQVSDVPTLLRIFSEYPIFATAALNRLAYLVEFFGTETSEEAFSALQGLARQNMNALHKLYSLAAYARNPSYASRALQALSLVRGRDDNVAFYLRELVLLGKPGALAALQDLAKRNGKAERYLRLLASSGS